MYTFGTCVCNLQISLYFYVCIQTQAKVAVFLSFLAEHLLNTVGYLFILMLNWDAASPKP